ncbi:MAG: prepilin peptidase [Chloroflexota bacterium]|nr:MAG: prepilin peptidase [Chloroflexota bacterium]HDD62641.1 prepilin peptidase [Chloroflexota bacterium]
MNYIIWFYSLLGFLIGSFLNVCIDRLPLKESILTPPSHCPKCQRRLTPLELIPVFSFLFLRGRCKDCGEKIPPRILLVEVGTGIFFFLIWHRFGFSWNTLLISIYCCLLIIIAGIDLEHHKVLNILIFPAIVLVLIMIPILHSADFWSYLGGAGLGFGVLFLIALLAPGAMGMGDVKLVVFLGLAVGFPEIIIVLFLAFVLGGLVAGILLALKKLGPKDQVAFAPYLALGGLITLLYGTQLIDLWVRSLGG